MRRFNPQWLNRPRKRGNPEGRLVLSIIKYLRCRGFFAGKIKAKGGFKASGGWIRDLYQAEGLPDIIAFTPSLIFIEAKSKVGVQSVPQKTFQDYCNKANIPYILAYSMDDVIKIVC